MDTDGRRQAGTAPMNVLFYTVDYKPLSGGIAEHTHQLASYFDRSGDDVIVVAPAMDGSDAFDSEQPFPVYRVPSYPVVGHLLLFAMLLYAVWKHGIDWVYCPMWFPTGAIAVLSSYVLGVKTAIAVHAHEVVYEKTTVRKRLGSRLRHVQATLLEMASVVIAVSSYTKARVVDIGVDPNHVRVVNNGVNPERFETTDTHPVAVRTDGPILLTVARLDPRKGHDTILEALPSLLDSYPSLTYVVAGDGQQRTDLESLAATIGVDDAVEFLGYVPDDDLPSLYNAADVFAMPNRRERTSVEGFGIVFLEANATGTPVVGGRHGGVTDAIVDGETGYLVDPTDPDAVADAIGRLLTDDDLRRSLGEAGRERVMDSYTWDDVGSQLHSILTSGLEQHLTHE
ncbi:glycosyltransferase family 4 protein [Halorarum halophilum]|uniref:Glycosyltransferase family 4 protein n=1 Tax=Halorarum halophilum TaxID=2743090 RepID=A0A7D5GML8_9EURY|nr:glycosyltransferase family 4 protein [Halobaculum halophilum]QLG28684.1 glycosyltransferase family 4 protein [Halobaculum halophilum]